jgi:TonB family protein
VTNSIRALKLALCCGLLAAGTALAQSAPSGPPALDAASAPPPPSSWFETRLTIEEYVESGDYAAALALGDHLLELAAAEFGPESERVAEAHMLLARVHRANHDYEGAEQEILAAVDVFEEADGPLAATLVEPYLDLGDNYNDDGNYAGALASYTEARNIGRRNYGLLNENQIPIIYEMSEAASKLGDSEEANNLQLDAVTLVERVYGSDSAQAVDAQFKYAAWLRAARLYDQERNVYLQIEQTIEQSLGSDPLMLVRTMRERAASFRDEGYGDSRGLGGLFEAVKLLEGLPDPNPLLLAQVWTDIGDWYVAFNIVGAGDPYASAWATLGQLENGDELRRDWFDDLTILRMGSLSRRGLTTDPTAPMGRVVVYFTIDTAGRPRDIRITESEPPGFKDVSVIRLIQDARFRPRIVDGELTPAEHAYRFEYHYEPLEEEQTTKGNDKGKEKEKSKGKNKDKNADAAGN